MMDVEGLAREVGFEEAAAIRADDVVTDAGLAALCNPKSCHRYGTCWTCPPGAGTYDELLADITSRSDGVLVQTVRGGIDYYEDWDALEEARSAHDARLDRLAAAMCAELDNVAVFSTGGCGVCEACTYPDAPCIRPGERRLALSAHGVAVGSTCKNAGLDYAFANGGVRFVGLVLYGES